MEYQNIDQTLHNLSISLIEDNAIFENKLKRANELNKEILELERLYLPTLDAISLAKKCVDQSLEQKSFIEDLLSAGLTEAIGEDYRFILEVVSGEDTSNKGLRPRLSCAGSTPEDPLDSFGAGPISIGSLLWKIAQLKLSKQTISLMILDETLSHLSPDLQERIQSVLERICGDMNLQLIMISHLDKPFGKIYKVTKKSQEGCLISNVEEINE